ncbi:unnamed protein product [Prunus armeniaca]|uniref:CCHC-type domain-containing protein n=1 Tax=Prunus armeniaca TaxID=36596 RepID=A0A6J5UYT2_PRUAR|nr:unnamed protein product [Prunus armeniaca]
MPPNYVQPRDKLRRLFIKITCRRCGQSGHNRATCDRQSSENQHANASSAQKEVHTKGGAVARGIRGWPRSMLRDMRRGLARGTGRANVAPAVAIEVATSSQQSLVRGVGRGLPRTMIRGLARGRANIPLSQSAAPTQESSNPSSTSVTAQPGSIFKLPAIRGGTFKWATIKGGTFKRTTIRGGTFKRPTEVLSQP